MEKASYSQRGETLDYRNNTSNIIEEDVIVPIKTRVGVTGTLIYPGEMGSVHVMGVFFIHKSSPNKIEQGSTVYFDGNGITEAENDGNTSNPAPYIPAGYAAADAGEEDTTILVKLLG